MPDAPFPSASPRSDAHADAARLPCGMRIIRIPATGDVVCCGIAVDAGTRDELPDESGLAHFCEHLSFKGTRRRRAADIIKRMDSVGGELNAYTAKEETVYYSLFMRRHLQRAIDLLIDITLNSTYPQKEIIKEADVVADEIESYNDSPAELIFDDFDRLLFPDHELGRNILGSVDSLRSFNNSSLLVRFARRLYTPERMVLFVLGNVDFSSVVRFTKTALKKAGVPQTAVPTNGNLLRTPPSIYRPQHVVIDKNTHQAHVLIGRPAYPFAHRSRAALRLLNNILGGPAMNSRLNMSLRERTGLVYTVESLVTSYSDTGSWYVYFGCDPADVCRCLRLTLKEMKALAEKPLGTAALKNAKYQMKGQIGLAHDNKESVAIAVGKRFLHYNTFRPLDALFKEIDAVTSDELLATAKDLFNPASLSSLVYAGPSLAKSVENIF